MKGGDDMKRNFRLKEARYHKSMTQKQLAEAIEMPLITYTLKENGKNPFNEIEIKKICQVLERDVSDLFF